MLNHGVYLSSGNCRLRPIAAADENNVLTLWNQDWVIGTLWSARTSRDTYRKYFKKYESDDTVWQWVVESDGGKFVGTIGCSVCNEGASFGWYALYPNRGFLAAVPCVLVWDFIFNTLHIPTLAFTCAVSNEKAKKVYRMLKAEFTGRIDKVCSQYGVSAVREHWICDRDVFNSNVDYYKELSKVIPRCQGILR